MKAHLHMLFKKKIFHYGYINTDTFIFTKEEMIELLHILKRLTSYLEDRKTPQRPIYTIMASTWSPFYDEISASSVTEAFRTVLMPDLFISKVHLSDKDSIFDDCRILPANILKQPPNIKGKNIYFFNLFTALKHASDLDKLRNEGVKTAALSVSVGLYGRWYYVGTEAQMALQNYAAGDPCYHQKMDHQCASIAKVCKDPKYGDVHKSEIWNCSYVVDKKKFKTFVYDTPETLQYKLCLSRKNATTLKYGLTAVGLEFSDAADHCGMGKFPMLTTVKKTLEFFAEKYKSPDAYKDCLSA
nr:uncharacterized protein LOC129384004 [Dermacentor andersoni]